MKKTQKMNEIEILKKYIGENEIFEIWLRKHKSKIGHISIMTNISCQIPECNEKNILILNFNIQKKKYIWKLCKNHFLISLSELLDFELLTKIDHKFHAKRSMLPITDDIDYCSSCEKEWKEIIHNLILNTRYKLDRLWQIIEQIGPKNTSIINIIEPYKKQLEEELDEKFPDADFWLPYEPIIFEINKTKLKDYFK